MASIRGSRLVLLVFSSAANASPFVAEEIKEAVEGGVPVLRLAVERVRPSKAFTDGIHDVAAFDGTTPPASYLPELVRVVRDFLAGNALDVPPQAALRFPLTPSAAELERMITEVRELLYRRAWLEGMTEQAEDLWAALRQIESNADRAWQAGDERLWRRTCDELREMFAHVWGEHPAAERAAPPSRAKVAGWLVQRIDQLQKVLRDVRDDIGWLVGNTRDYQQRYSTLENRLEGLVRHINAWTFDSREEPSLGRTRQVLRELERIETATGSPGLEAAVLLGGEPPCDEEDEQTRLQRLAERLDRDPRGVLAELEEHSEAADSLPYAALRAACHLRLGVKAANQGDFDAGVRHLEQAAALAPGEGHIREQLQIARRLQAEAPDRRWFESAERRYKGGDFDAAYAEASRVRRSFSQFRQVQKLMAACRFRMGTNAANERLDFDAAVDHLREAAALDPGERHIREQLEVARRLQAEAPVRELFESAERRYMARDFHAAYAEALRVSRWFPDFARAEKLMAECQLQLGYEAAFQGDFDAAVRHVEQAAARDPNRGTFDRGVRLLEEAAARGLGARHWRDFREQLDTWRLQASERAEARSGGEKGQAGPAGTGERRARRGRGGLLKWLLRRRRSGRREFPGVVDDRLHFSVSSPRVMVPRECYEVDVWAHLEQQRQEVETRARRQSAEPGIDLKTKGPVSVARGSTLEVRLRIEGLRINPREDTILWEGEIGNARFVVAVPEDAEPGGRQAVATIRVAGLEIARLDFVVRIGPAGEPSERISVSEKRFRKAFASYASEDRDAVLARIQGMQKVRPDLEVFLDVASLRSGENWRNRIEEEIGAREILYLFWSKAASESEYVDWEWRKGYEQHGRDFIDPVPMVSPQEVAPPPELADELHFNDWVLAYMSWKRACPP